MLLLLLWRRTRVADWLTNQSAVRVALIITFKSLAPGRGGGGATSGQKRRDTLNCKRFDRYMRDIMHSI